MFAIFINKTIGEKTVVSGNSSGGLISVWLAANKPALAHTLIIEDAPLFSSEYPRIKETISYEAFQLCQSYLDSQSDESFAQYYATEAPMMDFFKDLKPTIVEWVSSTEFQTTVPLTLVNILPESLLFMFRAFEDYDPRFGVPFLDGSWHRNFSHATTLDRIQCPTLLLHANWYVEEDGTLMGAMTEEEAQRACSLVTQCTYKKIDSGHVIHSDNPTVLTPY
jgi:pimeloyl-ACP methyl ester carboxylesterase